MGDRKDFTWLYDKLRIPPEGRRLVEQIRRSPPERPVGGGRHNIHGHYTSEKMGCTIQFESNSCELGYVIQAEFNEKLLGYYCQAYTLKHVYQGPTGRRSGHNEKVDYLEISEDGICFVSCKKEAELVILASEKPGRYARDESGKWRCPSGEAAAKEFGLGYKVVSSADFNPTFTQNLVFLADYLNKRTEPEPSTLEIFAELFSGRSYINLIELIECVKSADDVYRGIVTGHVYFELESELISQTHSAIAFRDRVSAKAYRCVMKHHYFDPAPQIETLNLKPGGAVIWDDNPWTVLNVGVNTITLTHDRDLAPISKQHFFELVERGHIKGADIERDPRFEAAMNRLLSASPEALKEADRRYPIVLPLLNGMPIEEFLKSSQTSDRTVREYLKSWRDAEATYGDGYIGLIPYFSDRGNRNPKLPELTLDLAKKVIRKHWLKKKAPKKMHVYGIFKKIARRLRRQICSDKTFYGLFKLVRTEEAAEARHGHKAAYQIAGPLWDGDQTLFAKHGDRVFAVAHIDHTEVDVEFISSVTRVNLGKAWLTLLIDAYSRVVLGYYLSFDRPSYVACMMAMRVCVAQHGRLPDVIVSDQGKEFKGRCFRRLAARHRCTLKYRPPSEPRFGAILERAFGSFNTRLFDNMEGNTQNSKKPRESSRSHSPAMNAVWSLPRFIPLFERFIYDVLPIQDHFGLLRTPKAVFDESLALHGIRDGRRIVYSEAFIFDSLPTPIPERRKVHGRQGIGVNYLTYWSPELREPKVINSKVAVKFDPLDAGYIWAYVKNRWIRCECTSTIFRGIPIGEVMWAAAQIKEDARRTGRNYRLNTQVLEDFFFDLLREEKVLLAEKKRIQRAMRAPSDIPHKSSHDFGGKNLEITDTKPVGAPCARAPKPLKSVHVKAEVSTR